MFLRKFGVLVILVASAGVCAAQNPTSATATAPETPDTAQQQEEKAKLEKKAVALLEQVVTDSQGLRLPENKIRVQIAAGDMLWEKNPARARGLLSDAGAMLAQVLADIDRTDRSDMQIAAQLRQDLVLTAGRHDAELGYQLLRTTQQQPVNPTAGGRRTFFDGGNLEQSLLATIAATDPKFAYQKAVESLDKGEFPTALNRVLSQLQSKDPEAFQKLTDKTLGRLGSDNLLANREATSVAINLLLPGPAVANTTNTSSTQAAAPANTTNRPGATAVLNEGAYRDLMENVIAAALSTTSAGPLANNARGGGGAARVFRGPQTPQGTQDATQVRQNNARTLLLTLQAMMTQVEQYAPERATAVRQKMTDLGVANNPMMNFGNQMRNAMQQGTSDSLETAAKTAPPQMQSRLYQQAAQKAIDEGNTDRAVQIANDHLDESSRNSIMQAVDFKKLTTTASPEKLNEIKTKLAALPSDSDRVKYLTELADATEKDNPKLALRFLEDARQLISRRATSYRDFEDQIRVADAFASLDPKRSFEIVESGITQLNELLVAANVLNGFEVDIFRDGELALRADSDLIGMVARFGQELAALAKVDFEGARMSADKFQLPEPRMNARLSIVQSILGTGNYMNLNRRPQNIQFFPR